MRFAVLGPLRVCTDAGVEVPLRSRHERVLLSLLLVRPGQIVTTDRLVDGLWPERRPASYASNLQTYVSRVRERLPGVQIEHVSGGYRIRIDAGRLDVLVFRREVAGGRAALAAADAVTAVSRFRTGLGQWRGRPFADVDVPALEPYIAQWEMERLGAVEDCVDAELAAGERLPEVLVELHRLVAEYPLRERLRGQLMVALSVLGRRAEALAAYQNARETLVARLGIEPGPQLRHLHQVVLRGEDPITRRAPRVAEPAASVQKWPAPCQLPPAQPGFVGREKLVERVAQMIQPGAAVAVVALSGQPGVGKSALAAAVAHRVRSAFPDGQLYVHLAGASAERRDPAAALTDLLRSLGTPESALPQGLPALSAAYRAKVADRRVLVVLDDADDPAQVRPLLPGTPGSALLVTSRRRLSGLIDARHVQVGPLSDAGAGALLAYAVGAERVEREKYCAARIAAACGNLPLALRIAGTRLATRSWKLRTLADKLENEQQRLGELAVGDQCVRAALALSVRALSPPARDAFGLLGLLGPTGFATWAVAALLGRPDVDAVIDELVEASLIEPVEGGEPPPAGAPAEPGPPHAPGAAGEPAGTNRQAGPVEGGEPAPAGAPAEPGPPHAPDATGGPPGTNRPAEPASPDGHEPRYRLHDLLRVYADELTADDRPLRDAARSRLLREAVAMTGMAAGRLPRTLTWFRPRAAGPMGTASGAVSWFTAELDFLIGLVAEAHASGSDRHAIDLADRLAPFLWLCGRWTELRAVQRLARRCAERTGDEPALARVDFLTGVLGLVCGDMTAAAVCFTRARAAFDRLGDRHGLACVLSDQAVLYDHHNRFEESAAAASRAIRIFRDGSDPVAAVLASPALSAALRALGRLDQALEVDRTAVREAHRQGAAAIVTARVLNSLAVTRLLRDEPQLAYAAAAESAGLLRGVGDRYVLLAALRHLASAAASLGRRAEAVGLLRESHALAVELGDRVWATALERDLAVSWIGDGRAEAAVPVLRGCLRTYDEMEIPSAKAATLDMLARAYEALGDHPAAERARHDAGTHADARDARTPALAKIILRLAEAPESVGGRG